MGKLGAIPRAQAITEGGRKGRTVVKLPPKAVKSSPEDWPFIEVCPFTASTLAITAVADMGLCLIVTITYCQMCLPAPSCPYLPRA